MVKVNNSPDTVEDEEELDEDRAMHIRVQMSLPTSAKEVSAKVAGAGFINNNNNNFYL